MLLVVPYHTRVPGFPRSLGRGWQANVNFNRNTARFLLQKPDLPRLFDDKELLFTARCALLAKEWKESDSKYGDLYKQFDRELRKEMSSRFDRYAILATGTSRTLRPACFTSRRTGRREVASPPPSSSISRTTISIQPRAKILSSSSSACASRNKTMKQVLLLLRDPPVDTAVIPYLGGQRHLRASLARRRP